MGSSEGGRSPTRGWSVFDGVKSPLPSTPEALMAEIDTAITAAEHAHATALLSAIAAPIQGEEQDEAAQPVTDKEEEGRSDSSPVAATATATADGHDARLADEAFKAACAALAAGRPDDALRSLRVALASCPPGRPSALSKLRSLVSIASSQLQKQQKQQQHQL